MKYKLKIFDSIRNDKTDYEYYTDQFYRLHIFFYYNIFFWFVVSFYTSYWLCILGVICIFLSEFYKKKFHYYEILSQKDFIINSFETTQIQIANKIKSLITSGVIKDLTVDDVDYFYLTREYPNKQDEKYFNIEKIMIPYIEKYIDEIMNGEIK